MANDSSLQGSVNTEDHSRIIGESTVIHDLFVTGKIYLIRTPVRGNCGIPKLHGIVASGILGVEVDIASGEEMYFVFTTKRRNALLILHIDEAGIDVIKRILFGKGFKILLQDQSLPLTLTREQLRRLVLDGSYEGEWESIYLKRKVQEMGEEAM